MWIQVSNFGRKELLFEPAKWLTGCEQKTKKVRKEIKNIILIFDEKSRPRVVKTKRKMFGLTRS